MAVFSVLAVLHDGGHSLSLRGELESDIITWQVVPSHLFNIHLEFGHHLEHGFFGGLTLLDGSDGVETECFFEELDVFFLVEVVLEVVV